MRYMIFASLLLTAPAFAQAPTLSELQQGMNICVKHSTHKNGIRTFDAGWELCPDIIAKYVAEKDKVGGEDMKRLLDLNKRLGK